MTSTAQVMKGTTQRRKTKAEVRMESPPPPRPVATVEVPDELKASYYYDSNYSKDVQKTQDKGDTIAITNRGMKVSLSKEDIRTFTPESLLARLNAKSTYYNHISQSYIFNRSTIVFECIMDFYNTGVLHLPHNICMKSCLQELEFWDVSVDLLCATCRNRYHGCRARDKMEADLEEQLRPPSVPEMNYDKSCRYRLWCLVERPSSSCLAKMYAFIIFASIVCSVLLLCLETLPFLRFIPIEFQDRVNNTPEENLLDYLKFSQKHFALDVAELVCAGLAFLDMFLRFCVSYDKCSFFKNPINLIAILYIAPSVAGVVLSRLNIIAQLDDVVSTLLRLLMAVARTLRVLRLFWIARHYKPLKVMLMAIKASMADLMLMFVATFLLIGVFSILMYNAEASASTFPDILVAMWWSVVTITTVGYGDFTPVTITGRLIATFCAFTGIMTISMVIPIVANHFSVMHQTSRHILDKLEMESRLKKAFSKVKEHGQRIKIKSKEMAKKMLTKHNEVEPEPVKDWYM